MIKTLLIITIFFIVNLSAIVIATGVIFKQIALMHKGQDPTKAIQLPKIPKTKAQKLNDDLAKEKAFNKLMELG